MREYWKGSRAVCVALSVACNVSVPDDVRLQSLSRQELTALCDEIADELGNTAQLVECGAGRSVALLSPDESWCTSVDLSACDATAGDMRACHAAARAHPCATREHLPEACAALFAGGCEPWATASPSFQICDAPAEAAVRPFAGIYEVVTHIRNQNSCAVEGGSVIELDAEPLLVVALRPFFPVEVEDLRNGAAELYYPGDGDALGAEVLSCRDLEHCRRVANEIYESGREAREPKGWFDCSAEAEGSLAGIGWDSGADGEACRVSTLESVATRAADGGLRLEKYRTDWRVAPQLSGCDYIRGPASGPAACSALEVYEARLVAPL